MSPVLSGLEAAMVSVLEVAFDLIPGQVFVMVHVVGSESSVSEKETHKEDRQFVVPYPEQPTQGFVNLLHGLVVQMDLQLVGT